MTCKKCGRGGFIYPRDDEDTGNWPKIGERYGEVVAFETPYMVPHWFICDANPLGKGHRESLDAALTRTKQIELARKEKMQLYEYKPVPPGQKTMPFEKMSELDRKIAEKVAVMNLVLDDIKDLLAKKAADI